MFRKIFTEKLDLEDYGLMGHGLGVVVAVAVGKGTPGSKSSNEKSQRRNMLKGNRREGRDDSSQEVSHGKERGG